MSSGFGFGVEGIRYMVEMQSLSDKLFASGDSDRRTTGLKVSVLSQHGADRDEHAREFGYWPSVEHHLAVSFPGEEPINGLLWTFTLFFPRRASARTRRCTAAFSMIYFLQILQRRLLKSRIKARDESRRGSMTTMCIQN